MQLSAPRGAPVIHRTAWEWNRGVGRTKSPVWLWNSVLGVIVWFLFGELKIFAVPFRSRAEFTEHL